MRLKIDKIPDREVDGVAVRRFHVGCVYEFGPQLGATFLAEGWGSPITDRRSHLAPRRSHLVQRTDAASSDHPLIMVVDDDPALRRMLALLLTSQGYAVLLAQDGQEGLDLLRQQSPDLVVLDLNMPVVDGVAFRSAQQRLADKRLAATPVVVLTAEEVAEQAVVALHPRALVKKPVDVDLFLFTIRTALRAA